MRQGFKMFMWLTVITSGLVIAYLGGGLRLDDEDWRYAMAWIRKENHNQSTAQNGHKVKLMDNLRIEVQKQLHVLQNPQDCSVARKLLCKIQAGKCGLGCHLHHMAICFLLATGTNRTLVVDVVLTMYPVKSFTEAFLPLSENCSQWSDEEFRKAPEISGDGEVETSNNERIVKILVKTKFVPFTAFAPNTYPETLKEKLEPLCKEPHVWWIGQLMTYISRLQPSVSEQLQEIKEHVQFLHPIVGVHIRRTDKLRGEAKLTEVEVYMKQVEKWFDDQHNATYVTRRVFLATDDPNVYREAKQKYPSYTFVSLKKNSLVAKKNRKSETGFWGIVQDLALLGECDHVVCTFSSNIGRLIYEKFLAGKDTNPARAVTVDKPWFYPGEKLYHEATTEHKPRNDNQMELQVGDILTYVVCRKRRKKCKGKNSRTNKTGRYPKKKVEPIRGIPTPYSGIKDF